MHAVVAIFDMDDSVDGENREYLRGIVSRIRQQQGFVAGYWTNDGARSYNMLVFDSAATTPTCCPSGTAPFAPRARARAYPCTEDRQDRGLGAGQKPRGERRARPVRIAVIAVPSSTATGCPVSGSKATITA